jgi:hypothetical protein
VRQNIAIGVGFMASFGLAALIDVFDRLMSILRRKEGVLALVHFDAGGHIWYIPMWLIGTAASVVFFNIADPFGHH